MRRLLSPVVVLVTLLAPAFLAPATLATAEAAGTAAPQVGFVSWPKDVVYVHDTTARLKKSDGTPVWPVKAAAARWSKGNPVDFRYTTTGCPTGAQCVTVKQSELAAPAVGVAATTSVGADIRASDVTLDTGFGRTSSTARRQNVVCHELGHALGLKHRDRTSSCMNPYVTNERHPDKTDVTTLVTRYGYR